MGIWLNEAACSFLAQRQSMHYRADSGREQDRATQRWPENQVEASRELKRNRHVVKSSPIHPIEQGQAGIQAEVELPVRTVSPKGISPVIPSGTPVAYNLYVVCEPLLIVTPSDHEIVINNQNQHNLWLHIGISEGER